MILELLKDSTNNSKEPTSSYTKCVERALKNLQHHINKHDSKINMIGAIQFQNLSVLVFSYGLDFCKEVYENLIETFYGQFKDHIILEKVSNDTLIFAINADAEEEAYNELRKVFKIIKTLPSAIPDKPVYASFHCGTTILPKGGCIRKAIDEAYIALFECSNLDGYTHYAYNNEISQQMLQHTNNMKLAAYFQRAIIEKRLRLAFQPIIDSKTGKVKHHEALLRIVTEENKIISAGPFIPVAEAMRFIDQIDFLVLELVVNELRFDKNIVLAMNISNLSIDSAEWIARAKTLLKDVQIASRLMIEITETSMYKELSKVAHFVDVMQSLGCMVAIDDFGAGYTSFTQLKMIHADIIKIDGIFIRDIVDNYDSRLFVQTLLEFSHSFGIKTVAEFVETGEIAKTLIDLNVDYMQGNYFSPALNYRTWVKDDVYKVLS